jgi:DNA-binding Lrp family transcriptional regulator
VTAADLRNLYNSFGPRPGRLVNVITLDDIDISLIRLMRTRPKTPVAELARLANVARGTAQARLTRLEDGGVIKGYGPDVSATAIGYDVLAFVTLEIAQGQDDVIAQHLAAIPQVLEVHAVTGPGDLLCRVVARSNEDLHHVLQRVLAAPGITRTETHLALHTRLRRTEADLVIAS